MTQSRHILLSLPFIRLSPTLLLRNSSSPQFYIVLILALFSSFPIVNSSGFIDMNIQRITLPRAPPGCCINEVDCRGALNSPGYCLLNFRLCISQPPKDVGVPGNCNIMANNFTVLVRSVRPFDFEDQTFSVLEIPQQRFNFTSHTISSMNISAELEVWSGLNEKQLLYMHQQTQLTPLSPFPSTLKMAEHGNLMQLQLSAKCSPGYVGNSCIPCKPPSPTDKYICTTLGKQCRPGWHGRGCSRPICDTRCENGGFCAAPNQCACPRGWRGSTCEECVPPLDCQNGYCMQDPTKCLCLPNWTGTNCDLVLDKCLEKPCKNGGRCSANGTHGDTFHCECPAGFTGMDCSISIAVCGREPCGRHGQCIPLGEAAFTCICKPGYTGRNCKTPDLQHYPFLVGNASKSNDQPMMEKTGQSPTNSSPTQARPIDSPFTSSGPGPTDQRHPQIFSPFHTLNFHTMIVLFGVILMLIFIVILYIPTMPLDIFIEDYF